MPDYQFKSEDHTEIEKFRKVIQVEEKCSFANVDAVYLDGKKDATVMMTKVEDRNYKLWK